MNTTIEPIVTEPVDARVAATVPTSPTEPWTVTVVSAAIAVVAAAVGFWAAARGASSGGARGGWYVAAVAATVWAAASVVLARRRPAEPAAVFVASVALVGAAALAMSAVVLRAGDPSSSALAARAVAVALLPVVLGLLVISSPAGRIGGGAQWSVAGATVATGAAAAVWAWSDRPTLPKAPFVVEAVLVALLALAIYVSRCRAATAIDRARLQWLGWGVVVSCTVIGIAVGLDALLGAPRSPELVAVAVPVLVPVSLVAATFHSALVRIDRLLVRTIVTAGLIALIGAVYLAVVVGLGRVPADEERSVLLLSMLAAAVSAVLVFPARRRLEELANQRIYGERHAPDEPLRTFATRMSRSVPMDELLLQLAESLKKSLGLASSEVWAGTEGVLELAASVPDRPARRLTLAPEELAVVSRSHVAGAAWAQVWLPELLTGPSGGPTGDRVMRVAPVAHLGDLLGLLVVERPADGVPFTEADDQVLGDLARQVGLALHNVRLDSALQASLDELKERNEELQASRLRIVTAADESRRKIERDLHDGAQQHLVAMAVKLGLARQLVGSDQATAEGILEELRSDVQATLGELRELAHGIYPPLLRDRGLAEALRTAANRAVLPVDVRADDVGRFSGDVEAAVYFCCLEAMQNAGKYAGDDARIVVSVSLEPGTLVFEVADDGVGFPAGATAEGHGFVNMRDRLGALGGELQVESRPGATRIIGRIPTADPAPA